jgi:outer membrane protein OmpA-like peptidoglycan-associated protein
LTGALLFALTSTAPATGQVIRPLETPYARVGLGPSVSETDISTYAVEPFSLNGEIGYQFSTGLGVSLGLTYADYPKVAPINTRLSTVQGLFRWMLFPEQRTSPYAHIGPQVTFGGAETAGGALFGLGVDHVITRRTSLFAELTAYATVPDAALDGRKDGRASFDGLGFWGVGVRSALRPAPTPVTLLALDGPERLDRRAPGSFTARLDGDATPPVTYHWRFGDGTTATGLVVDHAYAVEGTYLVEVTAINKGGRDVMQRVVTVTEPVAPATITGLAASHTSVPAGQLVRLDAAYEGTAPLDLTWDFGDGTAPALERDHHTYDGDRFIGHLRGERTQGYAFSAPGTYTVTLTARNRMGEDQRTVTVTVTGAEAVASRCTTPAAPDTLLFAFNSAALTPQTERQLAAHTEQLQACPNLTVDVQGTADFVGSDAYNLRLSERRAQAVRTYYADRGIEASRFVLRGRGRITDPCPPDGRDDGCAPHRRSELRMVVGTDAEAPRVSAEPAVPAAQAWSIVAASRPDAEAAAAFAEQLRTQLADTPHAVRVAPKTIRGVRYHRVQVGPFASRADAWAARDALQEALPSDAWLVPAAAPPVETADQGH